MYIQSKLWAPKMAYGYQTIGPIGKNNNNNKNYGCVSEN